ncbi:MAG: FumA C-terminus/TtdB family hydratase beta subunit [Defluviitaleaceae bacterium]|nr:FumA C-terminus/TtdB family hydratase beta subunit [Defluviitaleaceae bacterium]
MGKAIEINTPLSKDVIKTLKCGDMVYITGAIYTARDAAHKRMAEMLDAGEQPPFDYEGNIVFYAGPAPTKPGDAIGSIGPTTAGRMDLYAPKLIEAGLAAMIGKGNRANAVKQGIIAHGGIYFAGVGGIAAFMSQCVKKVDIVAFDELGTEAIRRLEVERLPVVVAIDSEGNDIYDRCNNN